MSEQKISIDKDIIDDVIKVLQIESFTCDNSDLIQKVSQYNKYNEDLILNDQEKKKIEKIIELLNNSNEKN